MSDYIQYHKVDERGEPEYGTEIGIEWRANRTVPKKARVWLVGGRTLKGRKSYFLYDWFIVDKVGPGRPGWHSARGTEYVRFDPPIEIGKLPWFSEFLSYMGNFGRGVSPLRPVDVRNFEDAARSK